MPLTNRFVGIDPGRGGAIASLYLDHSSNALVKLTVEDCPNSPKEMYKLLVTPGPPALITIEQIWPRPSSNPIATAKLFGNYELWRGLSLLVKEQAVVLVPPSTWKKNMGVTANKETSLAFAKALYPDAPIGKNHNRAEAILIARWGAAHGR